ncbi:hypothetical protein A2442_00280 [Candidatus Campbellbacteria bacterium RIFOXYC2_FULL_35_25]|uniref:Uncharacterized protein n=1 Tax=Candidatus Campbellbacteria bacterium RIFOXYC2_FULL_35_25 TaxID=1797582 RepID=A0A1F5EHZ1_9BACT|nr:MAG: hypothetical protein A2442_00280 [Candidatus Campbellbacteria bacterium RIFOXYC2_FULL_35_25]
MKKGFGLIGILIVVAIIAIAVSGGFYYASPGNQAIKESGGIDNVLENAENAKSQQEEGNQDINNLLNEI